MRREWKEREQRARELGGRGRRREMDKENIKKGDKQRDTRELLTLNCPGGAGAGLLCRWCWWTVPSTSKQPLSVSPLHTNS